jgi:asparagine synthase (glutamine-hydrolysing)
MCGVCGSIDARKESSAEQLTSRVAGMARAIAHRGPDDQNEWVDPSAGVALAYRRLAIIDTSSLGRQPMVSTCGRYTLVFNGEIYNFKDLRRELEARGRTFRGHSDTEVLVEAFSEWGFEATLARTNGMFGLAVWDAERRKLYLSRDRLGEKPIYYGWIGTEFLFGSEMRALMAHPAFSGSIDRQALDLYIRFNFIPSPRSVFTEFKKLPAGTWVEIGDDPGAIGEPNQYWSLEETVTMGTNNQLNLSDAEALERFRTLFEDSVERRMISDVPLGAFLSGGIDSSLVVGAMAKISSVPVRTFTIGFGDNEYDEAKHAAAVAKHLGTDHTELYLSSKDALDTIPRLPAMYDEPFADSSQIPTQLVAEMARQHVTVALSGDGGDESFAGYPRHHFVKRFLPLLKTMPPGARRWLAKMISNKDVGEWDELANKVGGLLPSSLQQSHAGDKLHKGAEMLGMQRPDDVFRHLLSVSTDPSDVVLGSQEPRTVLNDARAWPPTIDQMHLMMYLDSAVYLPDDILVKVDRATMATSLEARVPFLDHRLIEFAWQLPTTMKFRNGKSKHLPRELLATYLPRSVFERPKMGFGVPLAGWLRGDLREWAEALLDVDRLRSEGYFDASAVRQLWDEHVSGARDWKYRLWGILMFQAWLENTRHDAAAQRSAS